MLRFGTLDAKAMQRAVAKMSEAIRNSVNQSLRDDGAVLHFPRRVTVQRACGMEWTADDVFRFLQYTKTVPSPSSPLGYCRLWTGAKSRGAGNSQWYGSFWLPGYNGKKGKTVRAHKFAAVAILGLRPGPGEHLDHDCVNTLCTGCIKNMTKAENEAKIRRPKKKHLDLAKELNCTPAEVMSLEEHHPAMLAGMERLIEVAKSLEAGVVPPGVMVDYPRTHPRNKSRNKRYG